VLVVHARPFFYGSLARAMIMNVIFQIYRTALIPSLSQQVKKILKLKSKPYQHLFSIIDLAK